MAELYTAVQEKKQIIMISDSEAVQWPYSKVLEILFLTDIPRSQASFPQ